MRRKVSRRWSATRFRSRVFGVRSSGVWVGEPRLSARTQPDPAASLYAAPVSFV
jgi:hypothetical protein